MTIEELDAELKEAITEYWVSLDPNPNSGLDEDEDQEPEYHPAIVQLSPEHKRYIEEFSNYADKCFVWVGKVSYTFSEEDDMREITVLLLFHKAANTVAVFVDPDNNPIIDGESVI